MTGATGYVGGRLLSMLEARGERIRCLTRKPEYLIPNVGRGTEVFKGDLFDRHSLISAMFGIDTAYYLVHSMDSEGDFEDEDREAAKNFAEVARELGVKKIIYLGGLGDSKTKLSTHLRSRQEVGNILRTSGAIIIEFRASIVIGSGSLSFEMIRALVEKLPFMLTPRWVKVKAQPIGINDLLKYLVDVLDLNSDKSKIYEIGGRDIVSYRDIMQEYAKMRGLKRFMIPVPLMTPYLSSLWLVLVTPLYARVGRKLIDSIQNHTIVTDNSALETFNFKPKGIFEAIESALSYEDHKFAQTRWSGALSTTGKIKSWAGIRFGSRILDSRMAIVNCPPEKAFAPIEKLGLRDGWYFANWLWRLRGLIDMLVGGVGHRRGRPDPIEIRDGDTLDWWRVGTYVPNHLLRLVSEMRLPGRAWLEFEVVGDSASSTIRQTAVFDPIGVMGLLYWYILYPIHKIVFKGMLRAIAKRACPTGYYIKKD